MRRFEKKGQYQTASAVTLFATLSFTRQLMRLTAKALLLRATNCCLRETNNLLRGSFSHGRRQYRKSNVFTQNLRLGIKYILRMRYDVGSIHFPFNPKATRKNLLSQKILNRSVPDRPISYIKGSMEKIGSPPFGAENRHR